MSERLFSTGEVARASGVHKESIIRWDRTGVLPATHIPHGKITRRRYTIEQIIAAAIAGTLRDYGFSLEAIKEVTARVTNASDEELERTHILVELEMLGGNEADRRFHLADKEDPGYDDLIKRGAVLCMSLRTYVEGVRKRVRELGYELEPPRQAQLEMMN